MADFKKIRIEYEPETMIATTYEGKFCVATLDIASDTFEEHDALNRSDASYYYDLMMKEYNDYLTFLRYEC
jgi:hypothetical protein